MTMQLTVSLPTSDALGNEIDASTRAGLATQHRLILRAIERSHNATLLATDILDIQARRVVYAATQEAVNAENARYLAAWLDMTEKRNEELRRENVATAL